LWSRKTTNEEKEKETKRTSKEPVEIKPDPELRAKAYFEQEKKRLKK